MSRSWSLNSGELDLRLGRSNLHLFPYYGRSDLCRFLLGALLWGKWGLFELRGIQALKSSAVWCNGVARGVS